ncbi:uncharacterized protein G2W53_015818 [Senna tora]|uniref:Uncharacterized protein n=1 Tax=Senna tora TaxID=362788 RepID=A0A834WWA9_9FABA|nr:uncharacterized protein G2W53_015818 [Senna tora]
MAFSLDPFWPMAHGGLTRAGPG